MNNFIFTDIDGVLNPKFNKNWNKKSIDIYNRICLDFNLIPVITSTWRIRYTIDELQIIFINQGILTKIHDYTPILNNDRGLEIKQYLDNNNYDKYVVIDDKISDIIPYVNNIIHVKGYIGLTEEHYIKINEIIYG